ncbi:MAG: hypothetical protein QW297_02245, partial [Candidatus Jordarchaeales archaeon]
REVGAVIVAFKDRLKRFGFKYLERYFPPHNVKIEVDDEEPKNAYQDRISSLWFQALLKSYTD